MKKLHHFQAENKRVLWIQAAFVDLCVQSSVWLVACFRWRLAAASTHVAWLFSWLHPPLSLPLNLAIWCPHALCTRGLARAWEDPPMANSDEVRGEQAATSDDSRHRRLNTLLSSQSYLFSHVPTHLDDLVASKVGRLQQEQVQEHPHLARWSRHISSFRYVLLFGPYLW